jgi:hypothetical protein
MHTDVDEDLAREAQIRLDHMFEEYTLRTRDFAKTINRKLPFYLFSHQEDYYAAGGLEGSAGVFMVRGNDARLMATVIHDPTGRGRGGGTWHVMQHEGFHQFAHMTIAPNLPMWVNEGLAEYFGESRFTGDSMVSGLIPEGRRRRLLATIQNNRYTPFRDMLTMSNAVWNSQMKIENYDQAWSMVHFMAEGDGGKYQQPFLTYMQALAKGQNEDKAWTAAVGQNATDAFEAAWKRYWLSTPEFPTEMKYRQAQMMTLASFLARSRATGQRWSTIRDFASAAKAGEVKIGADLKTWLPASLLTDSLEEADNDAIIKLDWQGQAPKLTRQYPDGSTVTVSFTIQNGKPRTIGEIRKAGRQSR